MFVLYHTFYFNHECLVTSLSIFQGCINSRHLVWHITNNCFLLNCMHIAEIPLFFWIVLCIMRSLTFPTFYRFSLFIIFTMIIRQIYVLFYRKISLCIFKICSLIIVLRKVLGFVSETSVGLKIFLSLFKITFSFFFSSQVCLLSYFLFVHNRNQLSSLPP